MNHNITYYTFKYSVSVKLYYYVMRFALSSLLKRYDLYNNIMITKSIYKFKNKCFLSFIYFNVIANFGFHDLILYIPRDRCYGTRFDINFIINRCEPFCLCIDLAIYLV